MNGVVIIKHGQEIMKLIKDFIKGFEEGFLIYHSVKKINCPENIQGRCAIRFFYYISTSEYNKDNPPHKSTYSSMEYTHKKLYKKEL